MKNALAALALGLSSLAAACAPTSHPVTAASLGVQRSAADLEAIVDQPGPVTVETVVGADWEVDRSGLINLKHEKARQAGLTDGPEAIIIPFHAIHHPVKGLYLVDTGVEKALRDDPSQAAVRGLVAFFMNVEKMRFRTDTATWIARQKEPVAGVFLTHLHVDHVSGMRDVPAPAPAYVGLGEATVATFENMFVRGVVDDALAGKGPIREWQFRPQPGAAFDAVLDIFGDGTVWALSVPGHTPGSTAYLARTPAGPVLMVGDACHTTWGWENGVEPGKFSYDRERSAVSLAQLQRFVARHPSVDVRLGHQVLNRPAARGAQAAR